jgi:CRISPR system Cascade subunit CasE
MMFITKVEVCHQDAAKHRLTTGYRWHMAIWSAFGNRNGLRPYVYHLNSGLAGYRILMVSKKMPQPQKWGIWETKPMFSTIQPGQYMFQLRAHVVRRNDDGEHYLTDPEDLSNWVTSRVGNAGANVLTVAAGMPMLDDIKKPGGNIRLNRVDFQGVIDVEDPERLKSALVSGIGRARAFGYGLLQIKSIAGGNNEKID